MNSSLSASLWRSKLWAFVVHFGLTMLVAALAALVVFWVWFPQSFAQMLGGQQLFVLIIACDVVLGPLMSLVIFNPAKSRQQLLADYAVVAVIQLATLLYGLHTTYGARPLYLVFTVDRYVVVAHGELEPSDLQQVNEGFSVAFWNRGPLPVFVEPVKDPERRINLATSALAGGKDLQHELVNYRPLSNHINNVLHSSKPISEFKTRFAQHAPALEKFIASSGLSEQQLAWLPAQASTQGTTVFWTAIIDRSTGLPVHWLDVDPF